MISTTQQSNERSKTERPTHDNKMGLRGAPCIISKSFQGGLFPHGPTRYPNKTSRGEKRGKISPHDSPGLAGLLLFFFFVMFHEQYAQIPSYCNTLLLFERGSKPTWLFSFHLVCFTCSTGGKCRKRKPFLASCRPCSPARHRFSPVKSSASTNLSRTFYFYR